MNYPLDATYREPELLRFLQQFICESSELQLTKYCKDLPIRASDYFLETDQTPASPYGHEISFIQLWSGIGTIVLKLHFSLPVAVKWTAHGLDEKQELVSHKAARDYMREFNNMLGGFLREGFLSQNIPFSMSLPLIVPGEQEPIFRKIRDPRSRTSVWNLSDGEVQAVHSTEICLLEPEVLTSTKAGLAKYLADRAKSAKGGKVTFI